MHKSLRVLFSTLLIPFFSACAHTTPYTVEGETVELFGGEMTSWARYSAGEELLEAGVTLPLSLFENAPADFRRDGFSADAVVTFPAEVQRDTFLNHLGLFWEAQGHFPEGRYGVPHWDFHFFGVSATEADAIDCSDLTQPDPATVAETWFPPVPPDADPAAFCVPAMGFHSLPATEFKAPGELHDEPFDKVLLGGYYGGAFVFLEPMVTQAVMLERQSFSLPVPTPAALGRAALYPTKADVTYDPEQDAYHFVLSDFIELSY